MNNLHSHQEQIDILANTARDLQKIYASYYQRSARQSDLLNLPLIGAAGAAAGALLFGAHPDVLAGTGIAAGTYVAGRSVFHPANLAGIYMEGFQACSCYLEQIQLFENAEEASRIQGHISDLDALVLQAQQLLPTPLSENASAATKIAHQSAVTALTSSISQAEQALETARSDLAAYFQAPRRFERILASVQGRVAGQARAGRAVDFASVQSGIQGIATGLITKVPTEGAAVPASAQVGPRMQDSSLIAQLVSSAANLIRQSQTLKASLPGYSSALQAAQSCPNIIM